jgi:hypothetical protein
MDYNYVLTTSYDGELVSTLRLPGWDEAYDAWSKCKDHGDAKRLATYCITDPTGKMYTKSFSPKNERV